MNVSLQGTLLLLAHTPHAYAVMMIMTIKTVTVRMIAALTAVTVVTMNCLSARRVGGPCTYTHRASPLFCVMFCGASPPTATLAGFREVQDGNKPGRPGRWKFLTAWVAPGYVSSAVLMSPSALP